MLQLLYLVLIVFRMQQLHAIIALYHPNTVEIIVYSMYICLLWILATCIHNPIKSLKKL